MQLYAILRRGGWKTSAELEKAAARSRIVGDEQMSDQVRWIRTYVLAEPDGTLGTLCIYQGVSPEAIRQHGTRSELPVDEVIPIGTTLVVRPDPES